MLIITGDTLDPDDVTRQLQLQPWNSWRKGEKPQLIPEDEHVYLWGGWKRKMDEDWGQLDLEDQLYQWYKLLSPKRKYLYELSHQNFTVRLDCLLLPLYDTTTTICLDWELQRKMVKIGVDLTLCIYPPIQES